MQKTLANNPIVNRLKKHYLSPKKLALSPNRDVMVCFKEEVPLKFIQNRPMTVKEIATELTSILDAFYAFINTMIQIENGNSPDELSIQTQATMRFIKSIMRHNVQEKLEPSMKGRILTKEENAAIEDVCIHLKCIEGLYYICGV